MRDINNEPEDLENIKHSDEAEDPYDVCYVKSLPAFVAVFFITLVILVVLDFVSVEASTFFIIPAVFMVFFYHLLGAGDIHLPIEEDMKSLDSEGRPIKKDFRESSAQLKQSQKR